MKSIYAKGRRIHDAIRNNRNNNNNNISNNKEKTEHATSTKYGQHVSLCSSRRCLTFGNRTRVPFNGNRVATICKRKNRNVFFLKSNDYWRTSASIAKYWNCLLSLHRKQRKEQIISPFVQSPYWTFSFCSFVRFDPNSLFLPLHPVTPLSNFGWSPIRRTEFHQQTDLCKCMETLLYQFWPILPYNETYVYISFNLSEWNDGNCCFLSSWYCYGSCNEIARNILLTFWWHVCIGRPFGIWMFIWCYSANVACGTKVKS